MKANCFQLNDRFRPAIFYYGSKKLIRLTDIIISSGQREVLQGFFSGILSVRLVEDIHPRVITTSVPIHALTRFLHSSVE
jgi:hypothetical protein